MRISIVLLGIVGFAALAAATPIQCTSSCSISAASTGYTTPVFDVKSGVALVWHSTDIGHRQQDFGTSSTCLGVPVQGGQDSVPVTFTISGSSLLASINGATPTTCANAVALPDGSFELPYFCTIHATMRGELIVSP